MVEMVRFMKQDELSQHRLTQLQMRVLERFWNRMPAKRIAAELGISEAWVHKNLSAVRRQLNVNSSAEAAETVFGSKTISIKKHYYHESPVPSRAVVGDRSSVSTETFVPEETVSERALINRYGPAATIAGIVLTAVASILGVTLLIDAGGGMYQLWKALGY